jgi:hypothetical protein
VEMLCLGIWDESGRKAILFKVCKSVHHHTIQINQPTRCCNFSSLLLDVYLPGQHVSGVLTPIIRSSTIAVAASGFTFGACW